MPRPNPEGTSPNWPQLCETAATQDGYFTASQARTAGYSRQLLDYHCRQGRFEKVRRGAYRLAHFPYGDHDDLTLDWLWTERAGVVSHDSALALHGLSDVLPRDRHLSVPRTWRGRRRHPPRGLILHFAELVEARDVEWYGAVPVTKPLRTLRDCAASGLSPDLLSQAVERGLEEGRVSRVQISDFWEEVARR